MFRSNFPTFVSIHQGKKTQTDVFPVLYVVLVEELAPVSIKLIGHLSNPLERL